MLFDFYTLCVVVEDGRLFMWGDNSVGQIGLGDERFAAEPREVNVGEAVVWVSCGYHHSACVTGKTQSNQNTHHSSYIYNVLCCSESVLWVS